MKVVKLYAECRSKWSQRLEKNEDYEVDEKARTVHFTEAGNDKVEKAF